MDIAGQLARHSAQKSGRNLPNAQTAERLIAAVLDQLALDAAQATLLGISPSSIHLLIEPGTAPAPEHTAQDTNPHAPEQAARDMGVHASPFVLKIMIPHEAAYIELPPSLVHPHLLPMLTAGSIKSHNETIFYCTSPYYPGLVPLSEMVRQELEASGASRDAGPLLAQLGKHLRAIAASITFLHEKGYIHLDIKPENMMLRQDGAALLIDTSSARATRATRATHAPLAPPGGREAHRHIPHSLCPEGTGAQADRSEACSVVLTQYYAHPDLRLLVNDAGTHKRGSLTLPRSRLHVRYDMYAFGRSILALLAEINGRFPASMPYDYTFSWLHLAACRMLDGHNQEGHGAQLAELWPGLGKEELRALAYPSMAHVLEDFDKLFGEAQYLGSIPELSPRNARRVLVSEGIPAPLSERVRRVIEHPVFARLAAVPQIELLSSIFPTATHTRYEHSLGVFGNSVRYIHGLWNDAFNPLFRQLVSKAQIELLLLAALVHDLGQYPFGHTIEELGEEFRHENQSAAFLENPTRDSRGNTLREIIESPEFGWGIQVSEVKRFLSLPRRDTDGTGEFFAVRNLVEEMLHSILDGPIDADKLDYLVRDSHMCFLRYGDAIDSERLIANLTIVMHTDEEGKKRLSLGAYERGEPAAEAFSFTRYLLYQTLYWHHASRAGRSMFLAAIAPLAAQKGAAPKGRKAQTPLMTAIAKFLTTNEEVRTVTLADVLDFFEKRVDKNGQELIHLLRARRYYKRLYTVHEEREARIQLTDFRAAARGGGFGERLRALLRKRFEALLNARQEPGNSLLTPEKGERALTLLAEPNAILCDAPRPSIGAENNLFFVPEPRRLEKNLNRRHASGERVSAVWNRVHEQLMSIAAKGRVFCHPDIRDPLMALLSPADIEDCILEAMKRGA